MNKFSTYQKLGRLKNGSFLCYCIFLLLAFAIPVQAQEADSPIINTPGGIYNNPLSVTLETASGNVYFTLDGSEPTTTSNLYTNPINITTNTPLRVRTFDPPLEPSPIITHTYLFGVSHTFPIVAYTADPKELFDTLIGIYPNYLEDIEIKANIEFYENDGRLGFNQVIESEIQGTGSAELPQKSLAAKTKSSLGNKIIPYQVFPDLPYTELRSLVFRNSGQDWNYTMFRDAFATSLVANTVDVGGIIAKPDLCTQGFRPSVLYINGAYWGIHNVRERMDRRYLKVHFDLSKDEIDLLDNESEIKEGSAEEWNTLTYFLQNNTLQTTSNFQYVANKIDLDHYIDYLVFNLYIDNHDWPSNNNRRWRAIGADNQWHWMIKDLDFSFGFYVDNAINTGEFASNSLKRLFFSDGYQWPNSAWATLPFRRLIEHPQWRADFVNRMADQLNVLYTPERVNSRIDEFEQLYTPEIQQHHDRWTDGYQVWEQHVQKMRNFADGRVPIVRDFFISEIPTITGTSDVRVFLNPSNRGAVAINTIQVDAANDGWEGTYFKGIAVPLKAYPDRGYVLNSWSGVVAGSMPSTAINFVNPTNVVVANFTKGSTSTQSIIINEINYHSNNDNNSGDWIELYNPNADSVNIAGWYVEDESGQFFSIPKGTILPANDYVVLVESEALFTSIYPNITNYIGEFGEGSRGFSLSGGGELITLYNANQLPIDAVNYDDKAPWPTSADGEGATLQLMNPSLDNIFASSWQGLVATPNQLNGTNGDNNNEPPVTPETPTTPPTNSTCGVSFTNTSNSINISSLTAPHSIIKVYNQNYSLVYNCTDTCEETESIEGLEVGIYHIDIQLFDTTWQRLCSLKEDLEIEADVNNPSCNDVQITINNASMQINGLTAPIEIVQVYEEDWSLPQIFNCVNNCGDRQQINDLTPQTYHVNIQFFTATWESICSKTIDIPYQAFHTPISMERSGRQEVASLQVFPNPVKDRLFIRVNGEEAQSFQLQLINRLGQITYQQTVISEESWEHAINLEDLASGIYFLQMRNRNGDLFLEKVVVE